MCVFIFIVFNISSGGIRLHDLKFRRAGAYGYHASMSASHDTWGSDQHPEENIQAQMSQHTQWMNMFSTPPPGPTQDTQHDQGESEIPPRHIRAPDRLGWSPLPDPPPRQARRRH